MPDLNPAERSCSASTRRPASRRWIGLSQPLLPIAFDVTEKRTHDYVRHGTTNLFAALNVTTGEVFGQCTPTRDGADFLTFLRQAVTPHAGKDIHVVLDNLSTHKTPEVQGLAGAEPAGELPLHPDRLVVDQPDRDLVRDHHRQSIRRGTFASVTVLIKTIRDYITHWNSNSRPFQWTATADEILAKVQLTQQNIRNLVDNNGK